MLILAVADTARLDIFICHVLDHNNIHSFENFEFVLLRSHLCFGNMLGYVLVDNEDKIIRQDGIVLYFVNKTFSPGNFEFFDYSILE